MARSKITRTLVYEGDDLWLEQTFRNGLLCTVGEVIPIGGRRGTITLTAEAREAIEEVPDGS